MPNNPVKSDEIAIAYTRKMVDDERKKKQKKKNKYAEGVDDSYVEQFLTDANAYSDTIGEIMESVGFANAEEIWREQSARDKDLRERAGRVMAYLDVNRDLYDEASFDRFRGEIEEFQGIVAQNSGELRNQRNYYRQWDSEDSYNQAMRHQAMAGKYQGMGYQELLEAAENLEDGEEKQWVTEYADYLNYSELMTMDLEGADREIQDMAAQLEAARNREEWYREYQRSPLLQLTQGDQWRELQQWHDSFMTQYGSLEEYAEQLQGKRERMAQASQLQQQAEAEAEYARWTEGVRDAGTIQKELDALNRQLEQTRDQRDRSWGAYALGAIGQLGGTGGADPETAAAAGAYAAGAEDATALQRKKAELETELRYRRLLDYGELVNRPDFASKSVYVPTGEGNAIRDNATGQMVNTGFGDIQYDFINKNDKAQTHQFTVDSLQGIRDLGMDRRWMLQMQDQEVGIYNYLYATEGPEAAREYLDVLRSTLNQRQRAAEEQQWAQTAREKPVLSSMASILMAPTKVIGLAGQTADYLADGVIDQNAAYNRSSYISRAIRDQVTQTIAQNERWGEAGSFAYQTAMSMGDFLINALAGGGFQGVPGLTMAIMGSGAAADTVISGKDRGLSDRQSFSLGVVAGVAEALTERFSLEALLDADLLKNGIGVYVLKNSLTEGSEEVASSIINMTADILVTRDKSEWQQSIREYREQGYSEEEAFAMAVARQAESMGMDFLGGALSGAAMGGAAGAGYYADTRRTGRAMGRRGLTDARQVQQILDTGANADKGSAAHAVAAQLQRRIDGGKQLSQYEKGRLYQSNPQAVGEAVFGRGSVQLADPQVQGIDQQDARWEEAQRLASITGRDIKFYNGPENENGYFVPETGEIYVNTNAEDTVAQVVSHELTHSTELADSYEDLVRYVRSKVRAEGRDWELILRRKAEAYDRQGHTLESDRDIEAEVVAEYVQNHLLTNEQEIYAAVWESPTLGRRILNWIDGILAKLNNQKARERQMLHRAREIYAAALEEADRKRDGQRQKTPRRTEPAQTIAPPESDADMPRYMEELYRAGELEEADYESYLESLEHDDAAREGAEELGRQYSFAGEKARTADLQKLTQAKQMERQGVSSETIRQQTGWFRGMDKKWRFEIDDSNMRYHRAGDARFTQMHEDYARHQELTHRYLYGDLSQQEAEELDELEEIWGRERKRLDRRVREGEAQLLDILRHDALFEAYPELQGVKVRFEKMADNDKGTYYPWNQLIVLNEDLRNAPQRVLLHEVQHAIQDAEGFARGSSPDYWNGKLKRGEEPVTMGLTEAQNRLQNFEANPENQEAMRLAREMQDAEETLEYETMEELEAEAEAKGLTDKLRQYDALKGAVFAEESRAYNMVPSELYQNTAGEIEARDTANRWKFGLDAEGRKNTPPDLGDERTVFAGVESWMAELDEAYADRENYVDADISEQETEAGIREVATMEPVAQLAGTEFAKGDVDLITQVDLFFGQRNNEAYNPQIGTVILDRKGVKSDIGHGIGRKKAAAFAAVPDVIEKGRVVDYQKNWKSRGYDTAVIAAPILIGEEEHISAVIAIRSRNTNLFYVHEVLTTKNGAMPFKTGARKSGLPSGDAPSIFSILNRIVEVKNNGKDSSGDNQFSLAGAATLNKRDVARDLRAILSRGGDTRELQQYVRSLEQGRTGAEQTGQNRYQSGRNRNSSAQQILEAAHAQGQSVEEYLRWNPEQFEQDGRWRPEALEAMRMEQGVRRYSLTENKDSKGRDLTPEQAEYFQNSKVRDSNGRLITLYHQTENVFTVFDTRRKGAGSKDGQTPFGIFLKKSDRDIGLQGKKQMELYANITNPLYARNRNSLTNILRKMSSEYDLAINKLEALDIEYQKKLEQATNAQEDYMVQWRKNNPNASRRALYDDPQFNELYDTEEDVIDEWTKRSDELSVQAKEILTDALRKAGYDGIILEKDDGSWGRSTDAVIALDPEQVKNVSNAKPTSNPDIRYSLSGGKPEQKMNFHYTAVNPGASWFSTTDSDGGFGLMADGSVVPEGNTLEGMNELTGWRDQGLFAMYEVTADGASVPDEGQMPGGYYAVERIEARPKVRRVAGNYKIAEKGRIRLSQNPQTQAAPEASAEPAATGVPTQTETQQAAADPRQDVPEKQESQAPEIAREALPTRAQSYLTRAENRLMNAIGKALSVPRYARLNALRDIIREISDTYLQHGTIPDEKLDELFDKAYAAGIVADREFYEQYKHIKDHLRTYGVTIRDGDKSNIPDFNAFRKQAFGTVRILNEGGVPVDTAYAELHTMAPELFPESITHPADQLVRMVEVGKSIAVSQKSLDEYYGPEREEFRRWARNDFEAAVGDAMRDLRQVRRYAEDRAEEAEVKRILTAEEAEEAFRELKKLRRNVDKVRAKNLLTEADEILLGRMLKGEIGPQHLNPGEDNVKGIMALYEAKLAYESQNELLTAYRRSVRAKRLQEADRFLETAGSWGDKRAGILYARETMRRNILDIVPDRALAEQIIENYFEAVHIAEAKATTFKTSYRDRVRQLQLSSRVLKGNAVSEAHAVQLLGEAMDNIRVLENSRGRQSQRDGRTLQEWKSCVDNLWLENPGLDRQKILRAVEVFRKIYDELFEKMNRVRVENGYEPVNYRQGYFPHFQPGGDGIMAFFGKVMGINTQVDALPTTINGLTHTFKPGIQWFGNAQERMGFTTAYDAVEGFDRYIEGVASVIYQTENIQKLRALATQARYRTSDEGIRKQVDAVRRDNRLSEEEKQREINAIYEHGKFSLSNFVAELDEYTNLLANKKSKYDRTMESLIGRRAYTIMKNWENRVGANMIAGNISSALTNFIPLTQAGAQLDSGMILRGMWDTLKNMRQEDGLTGISDFLINRRGSDPLARTWLQKAAAVMGTPMELIDNFTSESIVRAAYLQNRKRGLSEGEAMHQADIFAAGVMADRSKGAMPTLFESRNPLFKAFTQFQLEVNNQFSEVFKDLPRNHREKGLAALALVLLKYFLGALLYNELFEKLIGRRSALDPFGILLETTEDLTGYEIPNLFDMIFEGDRIEKTGEGNFGEAGANLAANLLEELPFSAGLNLFGIETDGGRLPAASAVPDFSEIWDAATEQGLTGDQRWKMLQDELNKLAYVLPPFGGAQISKLWKGIDAYAQGGSYSLNSRGEEILQYPVYKDDPEDAFWSLVRAAFLGKSSLPTAQDWAQSGYKSLNAEQTAVYKDMLDAGVQDREAFGMIQHLRQIAEEETEDGARNAEQRRAIMRSELPAEGKVVAWYGLAATDKEREWMNSLADAGADPEASMVFVQNLHDDSKLKGAEKKAAQASTFLDSTLTEEEKQLAVQFIMDTDLETESGNPSQYAKFLAAMETGLTVDKYMEMRAAGTDIDGYLELTDSGIRGDAAGDLAISMATLEPAQGYSSVSWIQRARTVMEADLPEDQKLEALQSVDGMYESTYEKIRIGYDLGMNVNSYLDLKSIMPNFDANGNGSYTQEETQAAIDALAGDDNALYALTGTTPNGYGLTNREKAILWQLQNKTWKPNRNPYDRDVGQMVYDVLHGSESETSLDSGSLFAGMK